MKRTSIIILLVFAVGLLSACAHMTGPKAGASASPVIDQIVKRGELIVGTSGDMP
ncbi:MAG: hypothetical protein JRI70_10115, partial [Deltaproteobacteria bacterium]|nr:hypothetical protein [Deltaproteobacteria bacterium]